MKVITGKAKGISLKTLEGLDVRPTTDMVKGTIFNAIQFDIEGCTVLDLFAGSGQLGIEALSRGAKKAVFVDKNRKSLSVACDNIERTGFSKISTTVLSDAEGYIASTFEQFDIVFLDPPYNRGILELVLPKLVKIMSPYGQIICEHDRGNPLPDKIGDFSIQKQYRHGRTVISIYRRED